MFTQASGPDGAFKCVGAVTAWINALVEWIDFHMCNVDWRSRRLLDCGDNLNAKAHLRDAGRLDYVSTISN